MNAPHTSLFEQYQQLKPRYRNAVLMIRDSDAYITFGADAILVADRCHFESQENEHGYECRVPLAGLDIMMHLLIESGYCIAVAEPL